MHFTATSTVLLRFRRDSELAAAEADFKEEKERLVKLYKTKLDQTLKKLFVEIQRVSVITGGKEALMEIAGVLKKDAQPQKDAKP